MISRNSASGRGARTGLLFSLASVFGSVVVSVPRLVLAARQAATRAVRCQTEVSPRTARTRRAAAWPDGPSTPRSRSAARPGRSAPRPAPHAVPAPEPAARLHRPAGWERWPTWLQRRRCHRVAPRKNGAQQKNSYPANSGRQVPSGIRQSMPSASIASCAGVNATTPSLACGHTNRPRSRRLAQRTSP
jgi:hypothetical protein